MSLQKYTQEDIERIYQERVEVAFIPAILKAGLIAEWIFKYPNGNISSQCTGTWAMNPEGNDTEIATKILIKRIKDALWDIVGKYSLATGERL